MKKLFSFLGKLFSLLTFSGVIFYCIGYFFFSKTKNITNLFSKSGNEDIEQ